MKNVEFVIIINGKKIEKNLLCCRSCIGIRKDKKKEKIFSFLPRQFSDRIILC